jgi:heme-degrading monooxygenase HmoA
MIAIRSRWQSGSATGAPGGLVSATRTVVHRYRDLPGILRAGSRLLRHWDEHEGGIGVQVVVDLARRTSWTVSLWTSEAALRRFVRSDRHQLTIGPYRSRVTVTGTTFFVHDFELRDAWAEAANRLGDAPRRPCRRADR